jgi:hypothetical protein
VLLADLGNLDALGLGAGGVDYDHLADRGPEFGEATVEPLGFVADNDAKRDLLARAGVLHLWAVELCQQNENPRRWPGASCLIWLLELRSEAELRSAGDGAGGSEHALERNEVLAA